MKHVKEKIIYGLVNNNGATAMEVIMMDGDVDIETNIAMSLEDFIIAMGEMLIHLKNRYNFNDTK